MSWRHVNRRRQKAPKGHKTTKDFAEQTVTDHASKLLHNRWAMLCPFPLDKRAIYQTLFTDEQHRAIELLVNNAPTMIETRSELCFKFDLPVRGNVLRQVGRPNMLLIKLGDSYPLPDTGSVYREAQHEYLTSNLPAHLREPLQDWAQRWITASMETRLTNAKLKRLFEVCSTLGQIKRMWPNACNMLPEIAQDKLRDAKVRSPYPEGVVETIGYKGEREIKQLKEEWSLKQLAWFDDRITEALCLPLDEDSDPDKDASIQYEMT